MEKGIEERSAVTIQGLDVIDVLTLVDKKKNKFAAIALQEIEELRISEDDFKNIRKIFLDTLNEFTRSTLRALLGDIEIPPYNG